MDFNMVSKQHMIKFHRARI